MPEPLTGLERRILDFLVDYLRRNTYQPSIREIGRRFNIKSTKTVSEYLQALADKGWIERDPSRSRGVRLLGLSADRRAVTVRWYREAERNQGELVEELELDPKLAGSDGSFLITMNGDGLDGEGIRAGDLLLVEPVLAAELEPGDLVVAHLAGDPRQRRFFRFSEASVIGSSRAATAVLLGSEEVVVLGRMLSVVRRLRLPAERAAGPPEASVAARAS